MALATCHTEGCSNEGIPCEVVTSWTEDGETFTVSAVLCGVCAQPITDVVDT